MLRDACWYHSPPKHQALATGPNVHVAKEALRLSDRTAVGTLVVIFTRVLDGVAATRVDETACFSKHSDDMKVHLGGVRDGPKELQRKSLHAWLVRNATTWCALFPWGVQRCRKQDERNPAISRVPLAAKPCTMLHVLVDPPLAH